MIRMTLVALLCLMPLAAVAEGWEALARPGVAALMRHALAPGGGDPAGFRLDDPATQRNLSEAGREQARAVGAAIRAAGVPVDAVLSSRWNRSRETAALLGLGPVEPVEALDSFFGARALGPARTEALRALLRARAGRERLVLVTHMVNIAALTGRSVGSGEAVLVELVGDEVRVIGVAPAPD